MKIFFSRLKRRVLKHVFLIRAFILIAVVSLLFFLVSYLARSLSKTEVGLYAGLLKDFVVVPADSIDSLNQRTNILILGKGGEGHEAPDLTDTIIFTSISLEEDKVDMISLPRDIWLTDLRTKLNSVYYWGNKKEEGGGLILAKSTVEEIVGMPVHYAVIMDFSGFEKIIDTLGGIEVEVENAFRDERFPIAGKENDQCDGDPEYKCRYETISFEKGLVFMDGATALKFVRSRNAEGDEGTDLARGIRQQKVISAIKNKITSREILLSPKKLRQLKDVVLSATETDITTDELGALARKVFDSRNNLKAHGFSEDILEVPPYIPRYDNLYVFIPKNDDPSIEGDKDWSKVHEWVECVVNDGNCN